MEVKSVYMDLQEGVKKGNVWKLESEAFSKPIEIKIGFESKELKAFNERLDKLEGKIALITQEFDKIHTALDDINKTEKSHLAMIDSLEESIEKIQGVDAKQCDKLKELSNNGNKLNSDIESFNSTINHLKEKLNEFEKKLTKQPRIFKDKIFISGNEEVMIGLYDVPDGDYLCVTTIEIGEHNEYCENKDGVMIDKIHVQDGFTPRYQLYGGTELDTPTATVYYTLLLMPM